MQEQKTLPKPSLGRVVHYYDTDGTTKAAMITYVHSESLVNLAVFGPNGETFGRTSIAYSDTPGSGGWFWPPRL